VEKAPGGRQRFMSTAVGFYGERLIQARRARGIAAADLASMVEVSAQSLSKYENGHQTPRHETVHRLAKTLGLPRQYFFRSPPPHDGRPVFWRSKLTAQTVDLDRAAARLEWLKEMVDYLGGFFDFPRLQLVSFDVPDPLKITSDFLERAADTVRQEWGVKKGALPDIIEKLENSGILVSRIHVRAEKVDAFSQWSDRFGIPFMMLSRDKSSAARQRFDSVHELAHVLFHKNVRQDHLNNKSTYKILEKQADEFASYMLLPERDFMDELYAPTLDGMLSLKESWGVSVAAMIMRCRSLDLLDDISSKRMWMNYTRRGWRKGEPFDGKMEKESPYLVRRSFEMLLANKVQSVGDVHNALPFPLEDLEELADLEPGALGAPVQTRVEPIFKNGARNSDSNIVLLTERRRDR
jgi:Zn-dependent peptidase ImmA (M78 family)/DNA-binding XRE family transcriptional regulator